MFTIPALDPLPPAAPIHGSATWDRLVAALSSDIAPYVLAVVLVNLLWIGLLLTR